MKVLMIPSPDKVSGNLSDGISQVVVNYAKHLPEFGVELVPHDAGTYDLIAVHAGLTGAVNDVSHLHGMHWSGDYDAPNWEYRVNQRIAEAVRTAKQITVPSEWVAETIRRDLRVNPTVIPHGIDWADWQHDEPRGDYVLWNKNRADDFVCDPTPLVKLAQRMSKVHFVTTFIPRYALSPDNVNVIGLIPHVQMKKLVQSALVYLSTTKETFGIGILEAMASGVPVLGYAHGGIVDLVEHGVNGYLVPPGDIDGLAEGLRYCIQHRNVLGENGAELAKPNWPKAGPGRRPVRSWPACTGRPGPGRTRRWAWSSRFTINQRKNWKGRWTVLQLKASNQTQLSLLMTAPWTQASLKELLQNTGALAITFLYTDNTIAVWPSPETGELNYAVTPNTCAASTPTTGSRPTSCKCASMPSKGTGASE